MTNELIVNGHMGWRYKFRMIDGRPVEMKKTHKEFGDHGNWVVANNYCLKALVSIYDLCKHFNISEWHYNYANKGK